MGLPLVCTKELLPEGARLVAGGEGSLSDRNHRIRWEKTHGVPEGTLENGTMNVSS